MKLTESSQGHSVLRILLRHNVPTAPTTPEKPCSGGFFMLLKSIDKCPVLLCTGVEKGESEALAMSYTVTEILERLKAEGITKSEQVVRRWHGLIRMPLSEKQVV